MRILYCSQHLHQSEAAAQAAAQTAQSAYQQRSGWSRFVDRLQGNPQLQRERAQAYAWQIDAKCWHTGLVGEHNFVNALVLQSHLRNGRNILWNKQEDNMLPNPYFDPVLKPRVHGLPRGHFRWHFSPGDPHLHYPQHRFK